ncbi:MAG: NFACT family protein [Myxococcota bacterium]|nr:NFACT family protein [Myxococcota bacterium]
MLNLNELRRAARIIDERFAGHRLERCVQPARDRVVLTLYGRAPGEEKGRKRFLMLCVHPTSGRVSEVEGLPKAPANPPAFVSWIRAHLPSARLRGARILGDDRVLALAFEASEGRFELVLSLLAKRSNLYLLDAEGQVILALRSPADTRPELVPGAAFAVPSSGVPNPGEDRFASAPDPDWLGASEEHYASDEGERESVDLAREIRKVLKRETKNAERRLAKIESELAEADQASELQRHGELLKGSLGSIRKGASEVRVRDYATEEEVTIALDPTLGPRENLEATFKRYQKLLRRLTKAGGQVEEARSWRDKLTALQTRLEEVQSEAGGEEEAERAGLEAIAADPDITRLLGRRRAAQASPRSAPPPESTLPARLRSLDRALVPRRYRSRDGLEIWVGRSDAGNDHLTTRLARGKDLFFHLAGAPGSHVVLRTEGREDPPPESVLDACELAVHFSKQKNAGHAEVHVVPIKQVSKPRGAKKGLVYVTGGRSIRLRREEDRLRRLMDDRIEF